MKIIIIVITRSHRRIGDRLRLANAKARGALLIPHDDERFEGAKASLACHVRDSVRVQDPRNEARFAEELGNAELGLRK